MEEVRADNCVEIGAIQDDGVVCDREGVIQEDISEDFDGDIREGIKFEGADDRFGFVVDTRDSDCSNLREE